MITVPINIGFDEQRVIGYATMDETYLPYNPDYHLALGYELLDSNGKHRLFTLSVITDRKFKPYEDILTNAS